eukprot:502237_1
MMSSFSELITTPEINQYFQSSSIKVSQEIFDLKDELISIRRHLHRNPELSWKEFKTTQYILNYLQSASSNCKPGTITIKTGTTYENEKLPTGVVALLKGAYNGPCIMLRADIDALPVPEHSGLPFKSLNNGINHACGHDAHTSILLVTFKILCSLQSHLRGSVKFVFQPAEEGGAGAYFMIEDGVLNCPTVDQVYGLHVISMIPIGRIEVNNSTMLAGSAGFTITIKGDGGHGGLPHLSKDVIVAAGNLIQSIQTIVSRNVPPNKLGVISIGAIQSNTQKYNILPGSLVMQGTMRWFENKIGDLMKMRLREICDGISKMYKVDISIKQLRIDYPATINVDRECFNHVCNVSKKVVGVNGLNDKMEGISGSEDFSYFLNSVGKGTFFFLGGKYEDKQNKNANYSHHTSTFKIDERCLVIGCQVMTNIVTDLLYVNNDNNITSKL